jgi:hypothetical protein
VPPSRCSTTGGYVSLEEVEEEILFLILGCIRVAFEKPLQAYWRSSVKYAL